MLSSHERTYPWTHDLRHLIDLLDEAGASLPARLADVRRLTPWAAEFRYGDTIDENLDRLGSAELADAVLAWARPHVEPATGDG